MKKAIKSIAGPLSFMIAFAGLIVCMCDVVNLDKQFSMLCMGIGMIGAGTIMCILANREDEDDWLPR